MNGIKYFFRATPDTTGFQSFGIAHLILILVTILGTYLIYINKNNLKKDNRTYNLIKKIIGFTLLTQQIILYLWYGITGYSSIKESLPLYNCRIAIICTALALLTNKKLFKNIAIYWGVYGGILSILVVEGDPFIFPHYTIVSFFVGHIFLLWGTVLILLVDRHELNKKSLKSILLFTNIYHLLLLIFDIITQSNYDYLVEAPILQDKFGSLPQMIYSFLAIITFDILILLFHFIAGRILSKNMEYEEKVLAL